MQLRQPAKHEFFLGSLQSKKIAASAMQIDCKVPATQLAWVIVTNGIF
jgi:hypothetical protein